MQLKIVHEFVGEIEISGLFDLDQRRPSRNVHRAIQTRFLSLEPGFSLVSLNQNAPLLNVATLPFDRFFSREH